MDADECRRRFAAVRHAFLATAGEDRWPHVVPVVFALDDDRIVVAVDSKPKRTTALRRLRNIEQNPRVCFLVDHYDDDWTRLWWVRADARARVVAGGAEREAAVALLAGRYRQYVDDVPTGPVILAEVVRWSGWSA
jgi:PPOX class probable F420-dependent enzyme